VQALAAGFNKVMADILHQAYIRVELFDD